MEIVKEVLTQNASVIVGTGCFILAYWLRINDRLRISKKVKEMTNEQLFKKH
jgi:hypothetical protein